MSRQNAMLTIVEGCMFSGKSNLLIGYIDRLLLARREVLVVKPNIDDRYGGVTVVSSHNGGRASAIPIAIGSEFEILNLARSMGVENVAIDEVQFFNPEIVAVVRELLISGVDVFAAGLDTDFRRMPFGSVNILGCMAQRRHKLTAICSVCGNEAVYTQRLIGGQPARSDSPLVVIGAGDSYEARCICCHVVLD